MTDKTTVKTMEVKQRRKGEVKVVTHDLRVDDGVDDALPKAQQDEIRRRCGIKREEEPPCE